VLVVGGSGIEVVTGGGGGFVVVVGTGQEQTSVTLCPKAKRAHRSSCGCRRWCRNAQLGSQAVDPTALRKTNKAVRSVGRGAARYRAAATGVHDRRGVGVRRRGFDDAHVVGRDALERVRLTRLVTGDAADCDRCGCVVPFYLRSLTDRRLILEDLGGASIRALRATITPSHRGSI
jgi:hypothetical protein